MTSNVIQFPPRSPTEVEDDPLNDAIIAAEKIVFLFGLEHAHLPPGQALGVIAGEALRQYALTMGAADAAGLADCAIYEATKPKTAG